MPDSGDAEGPELLLGALLPAETAHAATPTVIVEGPRKRLILGLPELLDIIGDEEENRGAREELARRMHRADPGTCSCCGAPLQPLAELASLALAAGRALETMKAEMPDDLIRGVRALAAALPCHAGRCCRAAPNRPSATSRP